MFKDTTLKTAIPSTEKLWHTQHQSQENKINSVNKKMKKCSMLLDIIFEIIAQRQNFEIWRIFNLIQQRLWSLAQIGWAMKKFRDSYRIPVDVYK